MRVKEMSVSLLFGKINMKGQYCPQDGPALWRKQGASLMAMEQEFDIFSTIASKEGVCAWNDG